MCAEAINSLRASFTQGARGKRDSRREEREGGRVDRRRGSAPLGASDALPSRSCFFALLHLLQPPCSLRIAAPTPTTTIPAILYINFLCCTTFSAIYASPFARCCISSAPSIPLGCVCRPVGCALRKSIV